MPKLENYKIKLKRYDAQEFGLLRQETGGSMDDILLECEERATAGTPFLTMERGYYTRLMAVTITGHVTDDLRERILTAEHVVI